MTLLADWVKACNDLALYEADLFCGARKIIRNHRIRFPTLDNSLELHHAGYSGYKMSLLTKHYLHVESQQVAVRLWQKRRDGGKYGSVGFTTFNHFIKGDVNGVTPRGSAFGPCILACTITFLPKDRFTVDVFYRTTELMKKFPADLILIRDHLLTPFDFGGLIFDGLTCHFANITLAAMYWTTIVPHIDDPIRELQKIRKNDHYYWEWCVRWTSKYLVPEFDRGTDKFSQARRTKWDARNRIQKPKQRDLIKYLRQHHPDPEGARSRPQDLVYRQEREE